MDGRRINLSTLNRPRERDRATVFRTSVLDLEAREGAVVFFALSFATRVDEIFGKQCILLIERKNGNKCARKISVIWDKKKNKSRSRRLGCEAVLTGNK